MRILVHDYSGHPFQVQLSRALAARHHQVRHLYSGSFQTPHGSVVKQASDPPNFDIQALYLGKAFQKYSFIKRWFQEREYGRLLGREIDKFQPEVVISANTPLDAQRMLLKKCLGRGIKIIFWLQDLYGVAIKDILSKKYSILGAAVGSYYQRMEISICQQSHHIVTITEDFVPILAQAGIRPEKITVVPNWAPLEEIPLHPKDNPWSRQHGLHDKLTLLYSGTLGLKHNPELLAQLAVRLRDRQDVRLVVISEGPGADFLQQKKAELNLPHLLLFPFQPYEIFPQILAAGDILVAILEEAAGVFSVPSKILTYHCVGRPLLLAVPEENLTARIVQSRQTGLVVSPTDVEGFCRAAETLLAHEELQALYGAQARRYAEENFDIGAIVMKFERILMNLAKSPK